MISGIKLPVKPYMMGVTFEEIVSDLDLLKERIPEESYTNLNGVTIKKKTYIGERFITSMIEYSDEDLGNYLALNDLYKTMSKALPDFCISYPYSDKVILYSYPHFPYPISPVFDRLMDELQRITVFLVKNFGIDGKLDMVINLLRDYVDLCIEYPKN